MGFSLEQRLQVVNLKKNFTVIRCRDYRYTLQRFSHFTVIRCRDYRYTLQRLPLYVAEVSL